MGSTSLLAIFIFMLLIIPVSIYKIGYESKVPLIKHKFSFPLELQQFYSKIIFLVFLISIIYHLLNYQINYQIINLVFGVQSPSSKIGFENVINLPTIIFFVVLYVFSALWGYTSSVRKQSSMKEHIKKETTLFTLRDLSLFGLWSTIIYSNNEQVEINIDVLTDGDLLYTGKLYHFEIGESGLNTITLKNTKRFLVPISDIKGKDEKKYLIPGEFTYFFGSKIKNINLKSIIELDKDYVIWGETLSYKLLENEKFKEDLKKVMAESLINSVKAPTTKTNSDQSKIKKDIIKKTK